MIRKALLLIVVMVGMMYGEFESGNVTYTPPMSNFLVMRSSAYAINPNTIGDITFNCRKITWGYHKAEYVMDDNVLHFGYYKTITFNVTGSSKTYTYKLVEEKK